LFLLYNAVCYDDYFPNYCLKRFGTFL